jgi:hypothetical protein
MNESMARTAGFPRHSLKMAYICLYWFEIFNCNTIPQNAIIHNINVTISVVNTNEIIFLKKYIFSFLLEDWAEPRLKPCIMLGIASLNALDIIL